MLLVLLSALGYVSSQLSIPLLALGLLGTALVCASLGMLVAAWSRTLELRAHDEPGDLSRVFLSGSLYPVQQVASAVADRGVAELYTYGVDLLRHASIAGPAAASPRISQWVATIVVSGFSAAALIVAGLRFSRDAASEPLVHRLAQNR